MVSFLFYLGSTLCALYSLFFCDSFFFCFLMLFNITFSSSVIEIYKKKEKDPVKKLLFLFGNKNENAKKRDLYGFYFYYLYYY